jgi:hypothetical protein
MLSIFDAPPATAAAPLDPAAVSLALGGLAAGEAERLRARLQATTDAAVARASPLNLGLDDGPEAAAGMTEVFQKELPALTAAANLVGSPWSAPGLSVSFGPTCQTGATQCVPLFGPPTSEPRERRARALAWALSHCAVLRARAAPDGLASALHERQGQPKGTVALVFSSRAGALDEGQMQQLRAQATRALAHLPAKAPERFWLEAIGRAGASWSLPVALEPNELLVVPRLSVLARLKDFTAELSNAGTFDWVVRPAGG